MKLRKIVRHVVVLEKEDIIDLIRGVREGNIFAGITLRNYNPFLWLAVLEKMQTQKVKQK